MSEISLRYTAGADFEGGVSDILEKLLGDRGWCIKIRNGGFEHASFLFGGVFSRGSFSIRRVGSAKPFSLLSYLHAAIQFRILFPEKKFTLANPQDLDETEGAVYRFFGNSDRDETFLIAGEENIDLSGDVCDRNIASHYRIAPEIQIRLHKAQLEGELFTEIYGRLLSPVIRRESFIRFEPIGKITFCSKEEYMKESDTLANELDLQLSLGSLRLPLDVFLSLRPGGELTFDLPDEIDALLTADGEQWARGTLKRGGGSASFVVHELFLEKSFCERKLSNANSD